MLFLLCHMSFIIQLRRLPSNMREAFTALKSGELTKFSSRRDISSEVSHLFHFIFHRDPRYSRRGITKNIKQHTHMKQSCPSTSYS